MSSSSPSFSSIFSIPISLFQPSQTGGDVAKLPVIEAAAAPEIELEESRPSVILTEEALAGRLALARAEATHHAELRLREGYEALVAAETARIDEAIRGFDESRQAYFSRVEMEIVRLALSIAGKILHREAQVEPMLVAALVQIALTQLKDGSSVSIRVRPEEGESWRKHFAAATQNLNVTVVADAEHEVGGCVLETELGSADFSLDAQLKEVQQGFFDVLAQRP